MVRFFLNASFLLGKVAFISDHRTHTLTIVGEIIVPTRTYRTYNLFIGFARARGILSGRPIVAVLVDTVDIGAFVEARCWHEDATAVVASEFHSFDTVDCSPFIGAIEQLLDLVKGRHCPCATPGAAATAAMAGTSTSSTKVSSNSSTDSYAYGSYDASGNAYGASVGAAVGSGGWGVGASASAARANMSGRASAYGNTTNRSNTSVRSTNYDGAAAYQAYVIERDRVAQYDEALAKEREAHNEGYLKRTTIQPGQKISGLVYAKKGKGARVSATLELNGIPYYFEWAAPK